MTVRLQHVFHRWSLKCENFYLEEYDRYPGIGEISVNSGFVGDTASPSALQITGGSRIVETGPRMHADANAQECLLPMCSFSPSLGAKVAGDRASMPEIATSCKITQGTKTNLYIIYRFHAGDILILLKWFESEMV